MIAKIQGEIQVKLKSMDNFRILLKGALTYFNTYLPDYSKYLEKVCSCELLELKLLSIFRKEKFLSDKDLSYILPEISEDDIEKMPIEYRYLLFSAFLLVSFP